MEKIKVVELFAGVGGFRLAAQKASNCFEFIWANQWEPNQKIQHAFNCYVQHFGNSQAHVNEDITKVKKLVPYNFDLLVGGFPCQDYSVATTKAQGIHGKKGVLWWEINDILKSRNPRMVLLENVDRLLKSPVAQRGRDFAIMLRCFYELNYDVEWMVVNGADYGFAQRRKRVFIYAKKRNDAQSQFPILKKTFSHEKKSNEFKVDISHFKNVQSISDKYNHGKFLNYGIMENGKVISYDFISIYNGYKKNLEDVLCKKYDKSLILDLNKIQKMEYLRGSKKIERRKSNGEIYYYSEGRMNLIDDIKKPSRTMLTSEGTVNRSSHIILDGKKVRFLSPLEAERLNGFDDNWTSSLPNRVRYFCMGNALIVDLVELIFKNIK